LTKTFKVGDLTITPDVESKVGSLHPAIGVMDDTAYVGVWIPSEVEKKEQKTWKDLLYLITDKREQILANDDALRERGWRLKYKPVLFDNRWALDDVRNSLSPSAGQLP
jgi:hypothetical protein